MLLLAALVVAVPKFSVSHGAVVDFMVQPCMIYMSSNALLVGDFDHHLVSSLVVWLNNTVND